VNRELLQTHSHLGIGKRKKTERTNGREGHETTDFGQDTAISVEEEAIFVQSYKSRACDLDLEHTLDARSPGDHRVQVWSQSDYLPGCPPISPNPNSPNPISPNRYILGLGIGLGLGLGIWLGIGLGSGSGLGIGLGPGFDYFRQYNVIRRIGIRRNGTETFACEKKRFACQHKSARIT